MHDADAGRVTDALTRIVGVPWMQRRVKEAFQRAGKPMPKQISVCLFFWTAVGSLLLDAAKVVLRGPRVLGITFPFIPMLFVEGLTGLAVWLLSGGDMEVIIPLLIMGSIMYSAFPVLSYWLEPMGPMVAHRAPGIGLGELRPWQIALIAPAVIGWVVPLAPILLFFGGICVIYGLSERVCDYLHIYDTSHLYGNRYIWRSRLAFTAPVFGAVAFCALTFSPYGVWVILVAPVVI